MTREEAIRRLRYIRMDYLGYPPFLEPIDMAIEALQFVKHFDLLKEFQSLQEVVRCKDCDRKLGSTECPCCTKEYHINEETFYCAWGEMRG